MARRAATPDQKAALKAKKEADKAAAWVSNALAKLPGEKAKRLEIFLEADNLKIAAQAAAADVGAHKKRMTEVFGYTKEAIKIIDILKKCKQGVYEATVQQIRLAMDDIDRPMEAQLETDLKPGQGVHPDDDDAPVMDETFEAQRGDDPARAQKREPYSGRPIKGNKHLKKSELGVPAESLKTGLKNPAKSTGANPFSDTVKAGEAVMSAANDALKRKPTKEEAKAEAEVVFGKRPPPPPPVKAKKDDVFLDENDPDRQGSYQLN